MLILSLVMSAPVASRAMAQSSIRIEDRGVTIEFPERLTFSAHVESSAEIDRVILEYGVDKLTCGAVVAKALPEFEPGASADVAWTWEMLQSGSLPPGARIWYRWRVTDKAGGERVSDEQRLTWLDDEHPWQSLSQGMLTFHWYGGSREFAEDLLGSAVASLARLGETTGVRPQSPIDMYIYADTDDMRDAVLYEPGWTGGLAYPDHDILIIGISPGLVEWGKSTQAHELTHILVGHLTFSCLGSVPTWLNEGIAVYGEGRLDAGSSRTLQEAMEFDRLISIRALSGGFSEHPAKADLSYAQSYSIVNYLVEAYGSAKLLALFHNLRDGMPIEDALVAAYGFGVDALEDAWRASIGARPRRAEGAAPAATPLPTPVPTLRPIASAPLAPVVAATAMPTPAVDSPAATAVSAPASTGSRQVDPLAVALFTLVIVLIGAVYFSIQRSRLRR
jgi:hypothetical protein